MAKKSGGIPCEISVPWTYVIISTSGKVRVPKKPKNLEDNEQIIRAAWGDVEVYNPKTKKWCKAKRTKE